MKNPLSNELKVAAEIYRCELLDQKVWLGKVVELLDGVTNPNKKISKNTISTAIDTLFDWGIIKAEYGATERGRAGRLLMISAEAKPTIKDLYKRYWKDL
jgi:hypothetical protein